MRQVIAKPPNYDAIAQAFDLRGLKPVFAWGDKIYNPHGVTLGPELVVHERVHGERQLRHPHHVEGWWTQYVADPRFRLLEELLAHAAEYQAYCDGGITRNQRRIVLRGVAQRLASRLYGSLISVHDAKAAILDPEKPFNTRLPHLEVA